MKTKESNRPRIWITEDFKPDQFVYEEIFGEKFDLTFFESCKDFIAALEKKRAKPNLAILDLQLKDGNMLDKLAKNWLILTFPFFVVSAFDNTETINECFDYGAYDYLTKPVRSSELTVKVERSLAQKMGAFTASKELVFNIDAISKQIHRDGLKDIDLTPKEMQIICYLTTSADFSISKEELFRQIWGNVNVVPRTLDTHMCNLRKKIRNIGYEIDLGEDNRYRLRELDPPFAST
jgi:DNA-binding response OmpR family regulator